jgi:ATP:ADP antiporter, AAA family
LTLFGFATLAFVPALGALVAFQVLRRSTDYAIARPAREVLYTVVPREDRYKAKNFIDTVVYRGGDQVGAWSYALLAALGLGAAEVAITAAVLSIVWLINGLWLGREQEAMAAAKPAKPQTV